MSHADALYVVVDGSLAAGDKMAQAAHAVAAWCIENPELAKRWRTVSEYLIILETPYRNEGDALYNLYRTASKDPALGCTGYYEPDMEDDLTAIAFNPGAATRKLLANLPLAGRAEKRLEIIKDLMRLDIANEGIYEDEETGLVDLEWRSEDGYAYLQLGESRYGMFIRDATDKPTGNATLYFNGKVRDLLRDWDTISPQLRARLYPTTAVTTTQTQEAAVR